MELTTAKRPLDYQEGSYRSKVAVFELNDIQWRHRLRAGYVLCNKLHLLGSPSRRRLRVRNAPKLQKTKPEGKTKTRGSRVSVTPKLIPSCEGEGRGMGICRAQTDVSPHEDRVMTGAAPPATNRDRSSLQGHYYDAR